MPTTTESENYELATDLLTFRLKEYEQGLRKFKIDEIIKIKAALAADRPIADHIMTTVFNAFSFLHKDFPLENDEEFAIIMRFLEAFYKHTQEELLSKTGTHKDGLAMELSQETTGP